MSVKVSQQRLHKLEIERLKNIKNFSISFEDKKITGLLGPNGHGKSTILHALACCFQPLNEEGEDYKFSDFFLPNPDALWEVSKLKIVHSYRQLEKFFKNEEETYQKSSNRWRPRYMRRPIRNVHYFGIDKCVPLIEAEKRSVRINYSTINANEGNGKIILEKALYCLNRKYTAYNIHDTGKGRKFIGVETNDIRYSALSMSAGEQKVLLLIEKIYKAPKYSLILIDEFDLLLHDSAMKKLVEVIDEIAEKNNLQVVFTTHRESILNMSDLINVRHIFDTPERTLCFNETKPDAINRLTGKQLKLIEIWVEDDLAKTIIEKIASQLGIARHISVQKYGAACNCFTLLAGLLIRGESCENSIFVLDGDVYKTRQEQEKRIKAVLTGDDQNAVHQRDVGLEQIKCLNLPENTKPEQYIHGIIRNLQISNNAESNEIIEVAKQIIFVADSHKYVDDIIDRLGWTRDAGLSKIIDLVSSTQEWSTYVADVKEWLTLKKPLVYEISN